MHVRTQSPPLPRLCDGEGRQNCSRYGDHERQKGGILENRPECDHELADIEERLRHALIERDQAEHRTLALVEENRRWREDHFLLDALMGNLPDQVYFKDRESRFIRTNQKQAESFGLTDPRDAIGKTDFDFFTDEHASQARADEIAIMRTGQTIHVEEKETWPDRPENWVSTTKVPLRDDNGDIVGTFGISRDITERKRLIESMESQIVELSLLNRRLEDAHHQLLQSEKMASVGQLAAGVAHEINNPMGYVNSNLGSLKRQVDDLMLLLDAYEKAEASMQGSPEVLEALQKIKQRIDLKYLREDMSELIRESREGIHRVISIVESLKDYSRVDVAEWHPCNLEQGLESTLKIAWNAIKYKAEVHRDYAGLPEVECIGSQINQVFMNLLVNAAQSIRDKGLITLRSGFDETHVWIEIADSGCGIPPENLNRIFEPFFTTKPLGQGTGLGLSLSYSIVQRHHGQITVVSEPGQGTTFRVMLPRQRVTERSNQGD